MLDGWHKDNPQTEKKLPIEADISEMLADLGHEEGASAQVKAVVDLCMIAFYYLLCIGEYTVKGT